MLSGSLVELCWAAFLHFNFRDAFLACLGCFLGFLGDPLGPLSGILGSLLGLLGLVGPLLGCAFGLSSDLLDSLGLLLGVPFRTSWPKRRPGSDKVPQDSPKSRPRDPKRSPKSVNFVSFLGSFF